MKWSKGIPTEEGYYFWREDEDWPNPLLCRIREWPEDCGPKQPSLCFFSWNYQTFIAKKGDDCARIYKTAVDLGGEWCGPIKPPEINDYKP